MAGVRYELHCPNGFTYSGYQACFVWMVRKEEEGEGDCVGIAENVSAAIAKLWNARCNVLGVEECDIVQSVLGSHPMDGDCILIESGESFTLEDVAAILRDDILGGATIECVDGGEETTLKVCGEPYTCDCGETVFRKCGPGKYKCKCGRFLTNSPPIGDALDAIPEIGQ